jgi:hypothetical protein
MRKFWKVFALYVTLLLGGSVCFAQSTTASSIGVVDTDSFTWSKCTVTVNFVTAPNNPSFNSYVWTGGTLLPQYTTSCNGSGAFSISIPSTTSINPIGSNWQFQICPNATSGCVIYTTSLTGTSQDLTTSINAITKGPRFNGPNLWGYGPIEISTSVNTGTQFFNTTTSACQQYTGSAWQACGNGGISTLSGDANGPSNSNTVTGIRGNSIPTLSTGCLQWTGSALSWGTCGSSGVTSFTGDGTIINNAASTGAVTATLATQTANTILAGPSTGSAVTPTFRALVNKDVPAASFSALTDSSAVTATGTGGLNNNYTWTLVHTTGTRTLALSSLTAGQFFIIEYTQDSTGGAALTGAGCMGTNTDWRLSTNAGFATQSSGWTIAIQTGANAVGVITGWYDGTYCYVVVN